MTRNDLRIVVRKLRKTIEVDPTRLRILLPNRESLTAWCNSGGVQPLLPVSILSAGPTTEQAVRFSVLWDGSNSDPDSLDRAAHTWAPRPSTCAGRPIGRLGDNQLITSRIGL